MPTPAAPDPRLPTTDFRARHRRLVGTARRLMNDPHAAQEVVQEAYLRAWERGSLGGPGGVLDSGALDAWLTVVVRHLSIDRLRRRVRADTVTARLHAAQASSIDLAPSAERVAMQAQAVDQAMRHLLQRLGAIDAALWLLREVFGADHAALARASGRSPAACRQALHRAARRLRDPHAARPGTPDDDMHALVLHACRTALAAHDPQPLLRLLARPPGITASTQVAVQCPVAPAPRTTTRLVQVGGQFALAVQLGGCLLCTLPLGALDAGSDSALLEAQPARTW